MLIFCPISSRDSFFLRCLQDVIDLFVKMGFRSKRMDGDVINAVATLYFDRDDSEIIGKGINLQVVQAEREREKEKRGLERI